MSAWELPEPLDDGVCAKIVPNLESLLRRVEEMRRAGKRIVLTNGGFDLLHVGHVRSLRHARALGDHLVVAVNGDAWVRRNKGPHRPLFPATERVELVAALECVDTVFLFEDDTADTLLSILKPHIHAKGPDYTRATPEKATVLSYGGQVVIVGDSKEHSSSATQERLRAWALAAADPSPPQAGRET